MRGILFGLLMLVGAAIAAEAKEAHPVTKDTKIAAVMNDPLFGDWGRLLFPVNRAYWDGDTLGTLRLTWYSHIRPERTVEIVNHLRGRAAVGERVFYDIYDEAEKAADPRKRDTGLFFFKGRPGARFAVCNAGGGFAYGHLAKLLQ